MKPLNVHALNLALMVVLAMLAILAPVVTSQVQATMAVIAASFAVAATLSFWVIEATYPDGEVLSRFKSALSDYATFWTTMSFFLILLLTGRPPIS